MTKKAYPIFLEVSGDFGMFAEPGTGSEAVSHPLPPASACQGMIQSIAFSKRVDFEIIAVATCSKPQFTSYKYNSVNALKKGRLEPLQVFESVLYRPSFQIIALLRGNQFIAGANYAHHTQEVYFRRLRFGQSYHPVSIGRKEFMASYYGVPTKTVFEGYSTVLPSMVVQLLKDSREQKIIRQNVPIEKGVLCFADPSLVAIHDGVLGFSNPEYQFQLNYLFHGRRPKKS